MSLWSSFTSLFRRPAPSTGATIAGARLTAPQYVRVASTNSMAPTLQPGETVRLDALPFTGVRKGDIIVYWHPRERKNICHRAVDLRVAGNGEMYLICKGDNLPTPDPFNVTQADYIGRAVKITDIASLNFSTEPTRVA